MKLGVTLSFALFFTAVQSQQIPASSVGGTYRALPGIVVPAMPANLCTADNNYCVTQAGLLSGAVVLPSGGWGKSWTMAFIGQTKCVLKDGYTTCAVINNDGTVTAQFFDTSGSNGPVGMKSVILPAPLTYSDTSVVAGTATVSGQSWDSVAYSYSYSCTQTAGVSGIDPNGKNPPTDWVYKPINCLSNVQVFG